MKVPDDLKVVLNEEGDEIVGKEPVAKKEHWKQVLCSKKAEIVAEILKLTGKAPPPTVKNVRQIQQYYMKVYNKWEKQQQQLAGKKRKDDEKEEPINKKQKVGNENELIKEVENNQFGAHLPNIPVVPMNFPDIPDLNE